MRASRVNDRRVDAERGERARFCDSILMPWARKSPRVLEVFTLMYLHGISSGDFAPAPGEFFGFNAGLSPSVVTRLTIQWQDEPRAFAERSLADRGFVYEWADGVRFDVGVEEERLCCLVIVGFGANRTKELGALGFWGALADVYLEHMKTTNPIVEREQQNEEAAA